MRGSLNNQAFASILALEEMVGDLCEADCFFAERLQGIHGCLGETCGFLARGGEADDGRVGGFFHRRILASGFAENLGALGDVEDVIDDLKR